MGFLEIIIIFIVALLVVRPKKTPYLAGQIRNYINSLRTFMRNTKEDLRKQLELSDNEERVKRADLAYKNNQDKNELEK